MGGLRVLIPNSVLAGRSGNEKYVRDLALGPAGFGIMLSIGSVGGVIGAIAAPRLSARLGEGPLLPLGLMVGGSAVVLFPLALSAGPGLLALALLSAGEFFMSFGVIVYNVIQVSMRNAAFRGDKSNESSIVEK